MIDASLKWGIYNQLLDASAWSLSLPFPYVSIYLSQHETQTSLVFLQLKLRKKLFWLFKQLVVCELKLANSELTPILEKRIMYPNQLVTQTTSLLHYRIISTRTRTLLAIIHKLNRFHNKYLLVLLFNFFLGATDFTIVCLESFHETPPALAWVTFSSISLGFARLSFNREK